MFFSTKFCGVLTYKTLNVSYVGKWERLICEKRGGFLEDNLVPFLEKLQHLVTKKNFFVKENA